MKMKHLFTGLLVFSLHYLSAQNVGEFYGSTDGSESIDLKLGKRTNTSANFLLHTSDSSGSGYLKWYGPRYGTGYTWSRSSPSGPKDIAHLYGSDGADHYFQLFHDDLSINIQLHSNGYTYFNGGNVGIGTTTPTYKLEVNGTVRTKEVKLEAAPWPDYVFEENYDLRTLEETEAYIKENKHLPEIPSAQEVEANGIALGEMNALLLKKIEELTLYQIELLKRIEKLEDQKSE